MRQHLQNPDYHIVQPWPPPPCFPFWLPFCGSHTCSLSPNLIFLQDLGLVYLKEWEKNNKKEDYSSGLSARPKQAPYTRESLPELLLQIQALHYDVEQCPQTSHLKPINMQRNIQTSSFA